MAAIVMKNNYDTKCNFIYLNKYSGFFQDYVTFIACLLREFGISLIFICQLIKLGRTRPNYRVVVLECIARIFLIVV